MHYNFFFMLFIFLYFNFLVTLLNDCFIFFSLSLFFWSCLFWFIISYLSDKLTILILRTFSCAFVLYFNLYFHLFIFCLLIIPQRHIHVFLTFRKNLILFHFFFSFSVSILNFFFITIPIFFVSEDLQLACWPPEVILWKLLQY